MGVIGYYRVHLREKKKKGVGTHHTYFRRGKKVTNPPNKSPLTSGMGARGKKENQKGERTGSSHYPTH